MLEVFADFITNIQTISAGAAVTQLAAAALLIIIY